MVIYGSAKDKLETIIWAGILAGGSFILYALFADAQVSSYAMRVGCILASQNMSSKIFNVAITSVVSHISDSDTNVNTLLWLYSESLFYRRK